MCIPRSGISDSMTTVIYDDHEVVCLTRTLSLAKDVNVNTMLNKATVLAAVMRDGPALRAKIPDYEDVRRRSPPTACMLCATHCAHLTEHCMALCLPHRSLPASTKTWSSCSPL